MLIDTHSHLYLEHFREDIASVVDRCREHGVETVVLPNIDRASYADLLKLCNNWPDLFRPAVGLHPCSVAENWQDELEWLKEKIFHGSDDFRNNRIVGIGEIGLDYYWDLTFEEAQQQALGIQIEWAKELGLPVILHCREAFDDLYAIIREHNDDRLRGIFHCFTGTEEEAHRVMDLGGFYMGLGGVLTFKKSEALREVARRIPLDYFVLETDSPYLTPAPFRGKRNESSYVRYIAETLAKTTNKPIAEIERTTTENARRIFDLERTPA